MRRAGKLFAKNFPALKKFEKAETPAIAFFVHAASTLAHVQILYMALEAIQAQASKNFIPKVFVLSGFSEEMKQWFDSIGVEIQFIEKINPQSRHSVIDQLVWLRRHLEKERIDFLVWTCLPIFLSFVAGFKLAHRQVWFSIKFHPRSIHEMDGYIALHHVFSRKTELMQREWRTVPAGSKNLFDPSLLEQAQVVRQKFSEFDVIFGTLAREETMATPAFLKMIIKILRENPKAIWLYTGRKNSPVISGHMVQAGLLNQVKFIGWVDTRLYAQVIDIYVDCWPLGSGLTAAQAMAAGVPYVFYCGPTGRRNEWTAFKTMLIDPIRNPTDCPEDVEQLKQTFDLYGDPLLLGADSEEVYFDFVQRLVHDVGFRRRSGSAYRDYINLFYSNTARLGATLDEHLRELYLEC
jgi:hypothetical protein